MVHPLLSAGREIRAVARAETETHRHLRERIVGVAAVSVVVNLVCALLVFAFERNAPGSDVKSIGSALFFSSTQLLTVVVDDEPADDGGPSPRRGDGGLRDHGRRVARRHVRRVLPQPQRRAPRRGEARLALSARA
jgi:hypothetical protein